MNIFVLDFNPRLAAQYHANQHVCKMILELAQLLSTAHHVLDGDAAPLGIYKPTHINHPCAIWCRHSLANYLWTLALLEQLCVEYTFRYNKVHKTQSLLPLFNQIPFNFSAVGHSRFALAMPDEYKCECPVASYRAYYRLGKAHLHKYTKRPFPEWLNVR